LFNARSLANKLDNLTVLLKLQLYDLIFVTESWLNPTLSDALLSNSTDYTVFRKDRSDGYGGVAIFAKISLKVISIDLSPRFSSLECLHVSVISHQKDCRFVCMYHSPMHANDLVKTNLLCSYLDSCSVTSTPLFLVGDFNFANINWHIPESNGNLCHDNFLEGILRNGLYQLVTTPTRGRNCLDLVLTNEPKHVTDICVTEPFSTTCDHDSVTFSVLAPGSTATPKIPKCSPNFRRANYRAINEYLSNVDWAVIAHRCSDVNALWQEISNILNLCVNNFVPKQARGKQNGPKYPRNITKLLAKKRSTYKRDKTKFREISKKYEKAVKEFHAKKELAVIESGDLGRFYSYVNSKSQCKISVPPLKLPDGSLAVENSDKCRLLNDYFASVFTHDDGTVPLFPRRVPENVGLHTVLFSYENVVKALQNLPSKTSQSPDGFPALFLKSIAKEIAIPFAALFELSMKTGELPKIWKTANVCPVYKKGLHSLPSNYRPISLTCISCKVMERMIADSVTNFLNSHNLITEEQFGFLARKSTCTQLLATLNEWTKAANAHYRIDAVYIDFAKAFDSVSHAKLLQKVKSYGINYELYTWVSEFLSNRTQRVYIQNDVSDFLPVISGVPQGSVLGPLLFLIYINDITDCLIGVTGIKLFADDSKFYYSRDSKDVTDFSQTLSNFCEWSEKWQLNVAYQKCNTISFGNLRVPESSYSLSGVELERVDYIRDIGINLSSNLKPSNHCAQIAAKAFIRSKLLLKTFYSTSPGVLVRAYKTYVRPLLESCTQVWNPWLVKDIECLEKVQRFFTRTVLRKANVAYRDYQDRLKILDLKTLEYRRLQFDLYMCYKILHNLVKLDATSFFVRDNIGPYTTRGHSFKLKPQSYNSDTRKYFFSLRVVNVWNSLPDNIVTANSIDTFKKRLSLHSLAPFCKRYKF